MHPTLTTYFVKAAPPIWTWEPRAKRYRNKSTGQFVGQKQMLSLRDTFTDRQTERVEDLAKDLTSGKITIQQWTLAMREEIKSTYLVQYAMAHGGRQTMTQRDYGIIGRALRDQYDYLQKFAEEIRTGKYSGADLDSITKRIGRRAGMYIESGTQMYERGQSEREGIPRLPHYPGDGSTACLTYCRCHLEYTDVPGGVDVKWVWDPKAEHCEDCGDRNGKVIRVRNGAIENPGVWG